MSEHFEFDKMIDGIEIDGVPHVCLTAPGRPWIEGPFPEGTIDSRFGNQAMLLAPEDNFELVIEKDERHYLRRKD